MQNENIDPVYLKIFIDNAEEHIQSIEEKSILLEKHPNNIDLVHELFRDFHSLKGDSALVGLIKVNHLAHEVENCLDFVRDGKLEITQELISLIIKAGEFIKIYIMDTLNENDSNIDDSFLINQFKLIRGEKIEDLEVNKHTETNLTKETEKKDNDNQKNDKFVIFEINRIQCAIHIEDIQEVVLPMPYTRIPHVEDYIIGVINLRGYIIPVIDLQKRLELPKNVNNVNHQIIIAIKNNNRIGLRVDDVYSITILDLNKISQSKNFMLGIDHQYIDGITKLDDKLVLILKLDRILNRSIHK